MDRRWCPDEAAARPIVKSRRPYGRGMPVRSRPIAAASSSRYRSMCAGLFTVSYSE
ncbi:MULTISPECIES: hypothetical protein [Paenibacillus]|uniref:hypothetical protein n=1 Tax=Paenibacillus TaxID=44249 RepID=UPI0022B91625|nr:hypothetical protein [Paenibacillus caseinilyticus]MCZ8521909.1 hypothetical protein [Paenibacillus caseinilyticus]